eukprot:TRINITY_DN102488_c0_g1_i1.p1 TRINITY_DN102488_c0_g1~~TRINITY_DN102488_c0_g1_i1.p1  ORF type:complete len:264 (-),score=33.38 TRINITY_DN102488_c0_g1_i1:242-946(-)
MSAGFPDSAPAAAAWDELPVTVRNLSGESAHVTISATATVRELKQRMEREWLVGIGWQMLMLNGMPLEDANTPLAEAASTHNCAWSADDPLSLTIIVAMPYGGDIMQAIQAQDRDAVRAILTERDKDIHLPTNPAYRGIYKIMLLTKPALKHWLGWGPMEVALTEYGWELPDIKEAVLDYCKSKQTCRSQVTFQMILTHMEEHYAASRAADVAAAVQDMEARFGETSAVKVAAV